jgi:hypothetical protein
MGYYSRLSGELVATVPLLYSEFRGTDWVNQDVKTCFKFDETREDRDTDNGVITVVTARAIAPRDVDGKIYDLRIELGALAEQFGAAHTFTGYIVRVGEEAGDVERYWIEGTTAKSETARMSWPDGTEVVL